MSKWVVVTGAAGGIGQECARRFAADGYSQLLIDIPGVSLVDTVAAARDGAGEQEVSVLTLESTLAGFDACVDALTGIDGPIYALVHLAGLMERDPDLAADHAVWDRAIANNLTNAYDMTSAVAERFDGAVMCRLVFVSSLAFRRGGVDFVPYSAAKGGIIGMVRALTRRLGDRALVNAVAPGIIETSLTADLRARRAEKLMGEIPLGRFGHPREVASVIAFLLGEDSSYVTGQCINIDGGTINA